MAEKNPLPADRAQYGRGSELQERNLAVLHEILEEAAARPTPRSAAEKKIGDFYAACMDEKAIERRGLAGLKPELDRIAALKSKADLVGEIAHLQLSGVSALFSYGSLQDFKDATAFMAYADQGGLGLPERDYYTRDDAKAEQTRKNYVQHVTNMFKLLGDSPQTAAANAKVVMDLETALAKASRTVTERRDPNSLYHKMTVAELTGLTPGFAWSEFTAATRTPSAPALNVIEPEFFKSLESILQQQDLANIKTYLRWQVVHAAAPMLTQAIVQENFDFFGKKLFGQKEIRARWKRCVSSTDNNLGEALGQVYVERTFGSDGKERTLKMVKAIEGAMETDIHQLTWMSDTTKQRALEKLHAVANKIGYPDHWRDYTAYQVTRDDALGNLMRGAEFEALRQLNRIGKPVDHGEWGMSPPTVDAYYDAQLNDMNFPAGILQPPFFDKNQDDAVNFGDIGGAVGHELTHGFDDEGRQFDAKGNLNNWWSDDDNKEFERRSACLVKQYGDLVAVDDVHVNGQLTLGENVADLGGLKLAFMALQQILSGQTKASGPIDGFTPEQRFFISHGQGWCRNASPEALRLQVQTDPHSPSPARVNAVVKNLPEFQKAFSCKTGAPMAPEKRCEIW